MLEVYPDKPSASLLRSGLSDGFKLGYSGKRNMRESGNLKSISDNLEVAREKLTKEIKLNRIAGPFDHRPFHNLIVSPIGLVPKAEKGKFRMIHHLSFPEGSSINDGIDRDYCKVQYIKFDDAINMVAGAGRGAFMAKTDIESAFRLLPVHPSDFHLLGIMLDGKFFVDKALPMGASCSPALFEKFSTFVEWAIKEKAGSSRIIHFCDDFLLCGESNLSCKSLLDKFISVCKTLGVPLAHEKTVGPSTSIVFLGLQIDSIKLTVSVPDDKIIKISDKIKQALQSRDITLHGLQSLIGSLSFVCKAIAPGRPFLRRLIDLTCGVTSPNQKIILSSGSKSDLNTWLLFLENFNGVSIIQDQKWLGQDDIQLFTDASGTQGFGGFLSGKWFQGKWPQDVCRTQSIAWMEFFPIIVSIVVWGRDLQGKRIILRSDNKAVVSIINKQTSKCPKIMSLVRFYVLQCLKLNISLYANHIPGKDNDIADALSRFQMRRFRDLVPHAEEVGTVVPHFLWTI